MKLRHAKWGIARDMNTRLWRTHQRKSLDRFFVDALRPMAQRVWHILGQIISEPLIHFAIFGLALFALGRLYEEQTSVYRIAITSQHVAQLANEYALQFGAKPDPRTLDALIRRDTSDEILYRQGLLLKLDQDDEIVRRRVIQKMQFLIQDLNPPEEPTEKQLQAYYDAHEDRYIAPPHATFSHIFFSRDKNGDAPARKRALAVLATLSRDTSRAPARGDPFPDLYDFSAYEPEQVVRLFGHTPFAEAVFLAPTRQWVGPFLSAYGWHLIYVDAREDAHHPPLSTIHDAVRADFLRSAQDKANREAFDRLAAQFTIVRDDREGAP